MKSQKLDVLDGLVRQMRGVAAMLRPTKPAPYDFWTENEVLASALIPAPAAWGWPDARST
jgi:hypothetical protein